MHPFKVEKIETQGLFGTKWNSAWVSLTELSAVLQMSIADIWTNYFSVSATEFGYRPVAVRPFGGTSFAIHANVHRCNPPLGADAHILEQWALEIMACHRVGIVRTEMQEHKHPDGGAGPCQANGLWCQHIGANWQPGCEQHNNYLTAIGFDRDGREVALPR